MRALVAAGLAVALISVLASCAPDGPNAATIVNAWVAAINGRRVDEAITYFDDAATIDDGTLRGGAETIYGWDASLVDRYQLRVLELNVVSSERAILFFDLVPRGRQATIGTYSFDIWVANGKIQSLVVRPASPGGRAAERRGPVPPTATASSAAATPLTWAGGLVAALVLGLACWRRARPNRRDQRHTDGSLLRGLRDHAQARRIAAPPSLVGTGRRYPPRPTPIAPVPPALKVATAAELNAAKRDGARLSSSGVGLPEGARVD